MHTNFFNLEGSIILAGETIDKIIFYKAGVELGSVREIKEHTIENGKIKDCFLNSEAKKVFFDFDIKRSNKLNLNRKDAFLYKNIEKKYSFEPAYNLYIYADLVCFEALGEYISMETKHEKNYLTAYSVKFAGASFKRSKFEKIPMQDNESYKLQEGEVFSTCYGSDVNHKCIDTYDTNESIFKKNNKNEKGIIKRWFEDETINNVSMIIRYPYYTRCEKDNYLLSIDSLAEKAKKAGVDLSSYQIERLIEAGVITL